MLKFYSEISNRFGATAGAMLELQFHQSMNICRKMIYFKDAWTVTRKTRTRASTQQHGVKLENIFRNQTRK